MRLEFITLEKQLYCELLEFRPKKATPPSALTPWPTNRQTDGKLDIEQRIVS